MARTISIIGAGRVGRTLGKRLRELGWPIGAVVTRSAASSRAAVRSIGAGTPHAGLTRQALGAAVILFTTPDSALELAARNLAEMAGDECFGKVVLHTSGALNSSVLEPLARCGAATGSLHPMQTFSGRGVPQLEGIIFAVEGDRLAQKVAQAIARSLGGIPVVIDGAAKPAYHAAGAFVAGQALAVVEAATQMLMKIGFKRRRAIQALLPLMRQMLDNFEHLGPQAAWTGPISRGDYATVAKHMIALRDYPREFQDSYAALALLAGRVLSTKPEESLANLERALNEPIGGSSETTSHSR
jgi:predicted short-subunit dehydrogenase-like oxidoreductase (DUF2520 family)